MTVLLWSSFPIFVFDVLLRAFSLTAFLPIGDRKGFAQEETQVLQTSTIVFGLRLGGSLIHTCGRSSSGNRSNLGASDVCICV